MPRIPLYNQGQGLTQRLATGQLSQRADVGAFTAPGRALAQFGEEAGQIAFNFGMAERRKQDEDAIDANKIAFRQASEDFRKNNKTDNYEEFKDKYSAWQQGWIQNNTKNFSSRRKRLVVNAINPIAGIENLQGQNDAFRLSETNGTFVMNETLEKNKNIMANYGVDTVEYQTALKENQNIISRNKTLNRNLIYRTEEDFIKASQIDKYKVRINDANGINSLLQIDKEIDGRKDLDIDDVISLRGDVAKKLSYYEKGASIEFEENAKGIGEKIVTGKATIQEINELDNKYKKIYAENPLAYKGVQTTIQGLKSRFALKNDFDKVEFEDINIRKNFVNTYRDAYNNETDTKKILQRKSEYELAVKLYQNQQEILEKDPVGYIKDRKRGEEFTPFGLIAAQRNLGVPESEIKLYSNEEMKNISQNYLRANDVEKPELLKSLITESAGNDKKLFKQLFQHGFNYYDNLAALNMDTPVANIVLNARNFDEKKLSATERTAFKEGFATVEESVKENLQDWSESIVGNVFTGSVLSLNKRQLKKDEIQAAIINVAKFLVTEGESPQDAADKASDVILGNYSIEKLNDIAFRVPKAFAKEELNLITNFAEDYLKEDNLLTNVGIPKGIPPKAYLKLGSFGWVTNSAEDGVYLVNRADGDNAVLDRNGLRIEYKFTGMISKQSATEAKEKEDSTTPQAKLREKELEERRKQNLETVGNFFSKALGPKFKRE